MLNIDYTQELIGLKDVTLTSVERNENSLHIHIKMNRKVHLCPRCHKATDKIHDYRTQRIKDISAFGCYTFVHLRKAALCMPILQ